MNQGEQKIARCNAEGGWRTKSHSLQLLFTCVVQPGFLAFLIPFFTPMSYGTGFVVFAAILLIRFTANPYVNLRDFTPVQYNAFPYRIP